MWSTCFRVCAWGCRGFAVMKNNRLPCILTLHCPRNADILWSSAREWTRPDRGITQMNKIAAKVSKLSTEMLKDMAAKLNDDFRDGADLVQSAVLDALMARLPEAEFVAFCDSL